MKSEIPHYFDQSFAQQQHMNLLPGGPKDCPHPTRQISSCSRHFSYPCLFYDDCSVVISNEELDFSKTIVSYNFVFSIKSLSVVWKVVGQFCFYTIPDHRRKTPIFQAHNTTNHECITPNNNNEWGGVTCLHDG